MIDPACLASVPVNQLVFHLNLSLSAPYLHFVSGLGSVVSVDIK